MIPRRAPRRRAKARTQAANKHRLCAARLRFPAVLRQRRAVLKKISLLAAAAARASLADLRAARQQAETTTLIKLARQQAATTTSIKLVKSLNYLKFKTRLKMCVWCFVTDHVLAQEEMFTYVLPKKQILYVYTTRSLLLLTYETKRFFYF